MYLQAIGTGCVAIGDLEIRGNLLSSTMKRWGFSNRIDRDSEIVKDDCNRRSL